MKGLISALLGLGLLVFVSGYHLRTKESALSLDLSDAEQLISEDQSDQEEKIQTPNEKNAMTKTDQDESIQSDSQTETTTDQSESS